MRESQILIHFQADEMAGLWTDTMASKSIHIPLWFVEFGIRFVSLSSLPSLLPTPHSPLTPPSHRDKDALPHTIATHLAAVQTTLLSSLHPRMIFRTVPSPPAAIAIQFSDMFEVLG